MSFTRSHRWTLLERWSPRLFLAAGGILIVFAAINGFGAITGIPIEYNGFQFGYVIGFLGLMGLFSSVSTSSPWLARAGTGAAIAGVVGLTTMTLFDITRLVGLTTGDVPGWSLFVGLTLVGFVPGYFCFGVASLRGGRYSRRVGLVLLAPAVIVILMVAHIVLGFASEVTAFVISTGQAMAHLAIGATLRAETSRGDHDTPAVSREGELPTHE